MARGARREARGVRGARGKLAYIIPVSSSLDEVVSQTAQFSRWHRGRWHVESCSPTLYTRLPRILRMATGRLLSSVLNDGGGSLDEVSEMGCPVLAGASMPAAREARAGRGLNGWLHFLITGVPSVFDGWRFGTWWRR